MVQLQIDKDHSFDAYFPVESTASSLRDVTKLEFTQIRWTDDRLQRMSNLPDRLPALVELVLDGKNRKRRRHNFNQEEFPLSLSGLELIFGGLLGHPALRILRVTSRGLSGKDIKRLAPSIQRLAQLHLLDLSGNGYGVDGVLAVAACLSELPDLVELNVRDNNISRSDVGNANEYLYQHVWMALRMFREREGRVLIADPCVHGVLEERIHLLHPRFHIGWQLVMKKLHDVEEKERTILELGKTCQFLHDVVGQYYLHVADGLSLRNDDDLDSCQQYLPDVIPYTTFEYPDRGRNNEKKMHNLSRLLRRCIR
jgi:hypothetical protein